MSLTAKLHPDRFTAMSPKMTAIIAYVLGEEWTDPQIGWMSVSSDGPQLTPIPATVIHIPIVGREVRSGRRSFSGAAGSPKRAPGVP